MGLHLKCSRILVFGLKISTKRHRRYSRVLSAFGTQSGQAYALLKDTCSRFDAYNNKFSTSPDQILGLKCEGEIR